MTAAGPNSDQMRLADCEVVLFRRQSWSVAVIVATLMLAAGGCHGLERIGTAGG
jgi:hypothetical protein